jgi:hypothetical protein
LIDPEADYIKEAELLYAPPDHSVFELVPAEFNYWISDYYSQIGSPTITWNNVWNIYEALLGKFKSNAPLLGTLQLEGFHDDRDDFVREVEESLAVTIGLEVNDLQPLAYNEENGYMGGVQGGHGPDISDVDLADAVADFSSDEQSESADDE